MAKQTRIISVDQFAKILYLRYVHQVDFNPSELLNPLPADFDSEFFSDFTKILAAYDQWPNEVTTEDLVIALKQFSDKKHYVKLVALFEKSLQSSLINHDGRYTTREFFSGAVKQIATTKDFDGLTAAITQLREQTNPTPSAVNLLIQSSLQFFKAVHHNPALAMMALLLSSTTPTHAKPAQSSVDHRSHQDLVNGVQTGRSLAEIIKSPVPALSLTQSLEIIRSIVIGDDERKIISAVLQGDIQSLQKIKAIHRRLTTHKDTALHIALTNQYPDKKTAERTIEYLLFRGLDPQALNTMNESPLFLGTAHAQTDNCLLLMKHAQMRQGTFVETLSEQTPLSLAIIMRNEILIDAFAQYVGPNNGIRAEDLILAMSSENGKSVKSLLEHGADPNQTTKFGFTPLHFMLQHHDAPTFIRLLKQYGANLNAQDEEGYTLLHLACEKIWTESLKALLDLGADLTIISQSGLSPVHLLLLNGKRDQISSVLKIILSYRKIHVPSANGESLLMEVIRMRLQEAALALIDLNYELDAVNHKGVNAANYAQEYNMHAVLNALNAKNITMVHLENYLSQLISDHSLIELEKLVHQKSLIGYSNMKNGNTLFLEACRQSRLDVVKMLIRLGAQINKADINGQTALHIAARKNNPDLITLLIEAGALIDLADNRGKTAKEISSPRNRALFQSHTNKAPIVFYKQYDMTDSGLIYLPRDIKNLSPQKINFQSNVDANFAMAIVANNKDKFEQYLPEIDPHRVFSNQDSFLHLAVSYGRVEFLERMLEKNGNPNLAGADNQDVWMKAIFNNKIKVIRFLIKKYGKKAVNATYLYQSLKQNNSKIFKLLLENSLEKPHELLVIAAMYGHLDELKLMIETFGFDPNYQRAEGDVLAHALVSFQSHISQYLLTKIERISSHNILLLARFGTKKLIHEAHAQGFSFNIKTSSSPLAMAIVNRNNGTAEAMLELGVDPFVVQDNENTYLHLACEFCSEDIITRLVKLGLDLNKVNNDGITPSQILMNRGDFDYLLKQYPSMTESSAESIVGIILDLICLTLAIMLWGAISADAIKSFINRSRSNAARDQGEIRVRATLKNQTKSIDHKNGSKIKNKKRRNKITNAHHQKIKFSIFSLLNSRESYSDEIETQRRIFSENINGFATQYKTHLAGVSHQERINAEVHIETFLAVLETEFREKFDKIIGEMNDISLELNTEISQQKICDLSERVGNATDDDDVSSLYDEARQLMQTEYFDKLLKELRSCTNHFRIMHKNQMSIFVRLFDHDEDKAKQYKQRLTRYLDRCKQLSEKKLVKGNKLNDHLNRLANQFHENPDQAEKDISQKSKTKASSSNKGKRKQVRKQIKCSTTLMNLSIPPQHEKLSRGSDAINDDTSNEEKFSPVDDSSMAASSSEIVPATDETQDAPSTSAFWSSGNPSSDSSCSQSSDDEHVVFKEFKEETFGFDVDKLCHSG